MAHTEHARQLQETSEGLQRDAHCFIHQWRALMAARQALREQSQAWRQAYTSRHHHTEHGCRPFSPILVS